MYILSYLFSLFSFVFIFLRMARRPPFTDQIRIAKDSAGFTEDPESSAGTELPPPPPNKPSWPRLPCAGRWEVPRQYLPKQTGNFELRRAIRTSDRMKLFIGLERARKDRGTLARDSLQAGT